MDRRLLENSNLLIYGDSITGQANGDVPKAWTEYLYSFFNLKSVHAKGVGGRKYRWISNVFYADGDGNYQGRPGHNGVTGPIAGTTTHLGTFSSWDRITTMIPEALAQTIDYILLMGGTNDIVEGYEDNSSFVRWDDFSLSEKNTLDSAWSGPDYDASTFTGGMASCIMKLKKRCPKAKLIVSTPITRFDRETFLPFSKYGVDMYQLDDIELRVCREMGVPAIDLTRSCGINTENQKLYLKDCIHPNEEGWKMLSSALIRGLLDIEL